MPGCFVKLINEFIKGLDLGSPRTPPTAPNANVSTKRETSSPSDP